MITTMNESDLEKDEELKAIEFSKLTVGEIYSLSQWILKEEDSDFNRFKPQSDECIAKKR